MHTRIFRGQWQQIFQQAVEKLTQKVFQILELPIESKIFTLAIPANTQDIEHICLQPADCEFVPHQFHQVFELAKDNFDNDPEQFFFRDTADLDRVHADGSATLYFRDPETFRETGCVIRCRYWPGP